MKKSTNTGYMLKTSQKGYTLVELMIAVVVGGIITGATFVTFIFQQRSYTVQETVAETQQNIRAAMMVMAQDIRMAGYDPKQQLGGCPERKIAIAESNRFVFYVDKNENGFWPSAAAEPTNPCNVDGGCSPNCVFGTEDELTYELYPVNGQNILSLRKVAGQPAIAENINNLEFQYIDAAGNVLTSPVLGQLKNNIRAVRVSLLVQASRPDENFTNTRVYCPASNPFDSSTGTCTEGFGTQWMPYSDNFRRRLLITTFQCRNMGL